MPVRTRVTLIAIASIFLLALTTSAGMVGKVVDKTDAYTMMGKQSPASVDTLTYYWSGDRIRMDTNDTMSVIVTKGSTTATMLMHNSSRYIVMPLEGGVDSLVSEIRAAKGDQAAAQLQAMMGMMKLSLSVTQTDETKEIKGYNTKKHVVKIGIGQMSLESEVWATTDIEIPQELVNTVANLRLSVYPGFDDAVVEMKKMEGIAVQTNTTISTMGTSFSNTTELVSMEETDISADTFEIPKGYTQQTLAAMAGM